MSRWSRVFFVAAVIVLITPAMLAMTSRTFERALPPDVSADKLVLKKDARRLTLFADGKPVKSYRVALGFSPEGKKRCQGDGKTPEGDYVIDYRNPNSTCHLSLHVSYPAAADRSAAAELGCDPGGDIMIHGLPNGYGFVGAAQRLIDWTAGCVAVTDAEMDELWRAVRVGTPITILP
jgi:murein L,D-transpeptidase YafK